MSTASGDASTVERVALPAREPATFMTQADALMRKNLTYQKRNVKTNLCLILYPLLLCILLFVIQEAVNHELDKPSYRCGCKCVENTGNGSCKKVCGLQYSDLDQASYCAIQSPPEWPAFLQVPGSQYRAVNYGSSEYADLPESSCLNSGSCPVTFLYTGQNKSLAEALSSNLITDALPTSYSNSLEVFSVLIPGTDTYTEYQNYIEPAVLSSTPIYVLRPSCSGNSANLNLTDSFTGAGLTFSVGYQCVEGRSLWRDNSSIINRELYAGYYDGNSGKKIDEYVAAYDFMNSNAKNFNVTIFYNATFQNESAFDPPALLRIPRSINLISQAFLSLWKGSTVRMPLQFTKEMPKSETRESFDFSSVLGPLFFLWVILLLFPVILKSLVYEKENKLRIMMKMHGLGDGPYWLITYAYFLMISVLYMLCFVIFGSVIGLKFFTLNDYGIQAILYFIYLNLQIAVGFLAALVFKRTKTATIVGYKYVFGFGLLSAFLFQYLMEDKNFSRVWVRLMELLPGFSLYRGLYEFGEYSYTADNQGTEGMRWKNLNDEDNGMKEVWIIMVVEWIIILPLAYYLDQVVSTGSGIRKNPLFFLPWKKAGELKSFRKKSLKRSGIIVAVEMEQADVAEERVKVEKILQELDQLQAIVCNDLQKVYPSQDGNAPKYAVHGLTLAVPRGECFGLLGPNGAGKTTSISMITGLLPPTSGTAYIEGLDILKDMDKIYARMGVCPQHDLIWETLTGREHLLFYGRLKNLKGETLHRAVNESLRSVDLYNGGVGDKASGKYSGGMKRRLSVAISLIGDPKVVYMDEPSTGLDPASRNKLWKVVKQAKKDRAIILTTHSMEEAEVLCDRIGIFVDGRLQCIGSCEELKTRYGGSYILTVTTSAGEEPVMGQLVQELCPDARVVYSLSGTQKFELAKAHVKIADVFRMIANAKALVTIHAWGVVDTTLEEVFVNVARASFASNSHT